MNFNNIFDKNMVLLESIIENKYNENKNNKDTTYYFYNLDEFIKHAKDGSISKKRSLIIFNLLKKYKPYKILEIGSFLGFSTKIINEALDKKCKIISVDPNVRHRIFDNPRYYFDLLNKDSNNIKKINKIFSRISNETGTYDYLNYNPKLNSKETNNILSNIEVINYNYFNEKFDCCFIDGAHDYKSVLNNFSDAINVLNSGSIIIFDDYNINDWKETYYAINYIIKIGGKEIEFNIVGEIVLIKDLGLFKRIKKNPNIII